MTLPPFDGPRRQQATATLPGDTRTGLGLDGGLPVRPGLPRAPEAPGPSGGLGPGAFGKKAIEPGTASPQATPPGAPGAGGAAGGAPPLPWFEAERESLNLARRPFVNGRPVGRLATILWVLGALLLAADVTLFMGYLTSSQTTRTKLGTLEGEIAREQRDGAELKANLGKLGLEQQNREVTFLNRKIDERTFSWSLLFDRMAEVLPDEVRLLRLKPANVVERDIGLGPRPSARELKPLPVTLSLYCEAKDDEAVLRFVDNLFAHPAFSEPNLEREERLDSGGLRFDVTVQYQPNTPAAAAFRPPAARTARRSRHSAGAAGTAAPAPAPAPGTAGAGASAAGSAGGAGNPAAAGSPAAPPPAAAWSAGSGLIREPAGAGLIRVAPPPRRPGSRVPPAPPLQSAPGGPIPPGSVPPGRPGGPINPGSRGSAAPLEAPGEGGGGR
ncbi:MAG TPA: hypothetical protein VMW75_10105 [Thermoanaerobaculia bacterium]|nr:hypothetical protein [Thermoanaerobaculia bacterium]